LSENTSQVLVEEGPGDLSGWGILLGFGNLPILVKVEFILIEK